MMTPPADLREPIVERRPGTIPDTIYVWDLPTRLFHWLLVVSVTVSFLTGFIAPEWWMGVHTWAGYTVVALILFRLVWGLFGSEYARFSNMARATRHLRDYLRGLLLLRPPHYFGHNPAGVLMIVALAATLIGLTTTGLLVLGGEEKQGPAAGVTTYTVGYAAKAIHSILSFAFLALIAGHIAGVIGESLIQRENLTRAMITGRKHLKPGTHVPRIRAGRPLLAAIAMMAIAALLTVALSNLALWPPTGSRRLAENTAYEAECGACHYAFHPSLLPAESWQQIMANLDDHFGEDASLGPDATKAITQWLSANAAETWDTEAANRFRVLAADQPLRITATPYWIAKHDDIAEAVFQRKAVGSKINCVACHRDAGTGRFDDQAIGIPKE
jgi:cytochrome b